MKTISIFKQWEKRATYSDSSGQNRFSVVQMRWLIAGILCLAFVVIFRSWDHFLLPAFYAEDSIHYFNRYYGGDHSLKDILAHPHGYYNIFNNFAALLIAKLDILLQPLSYHITAFFVGIITVATFSFSGLIRNKHILFITPLLLGLSGMNHIYYYITITFQMYVLIILALSLLFHNNKPEGITSIPFFIILCLLIWSGPYSVLIVPYSLCYIFLFKDKTLFFVALITVCMLYLFSVSVSTVRLEHLFNPYILSYWGKALASQIFYMEIIERVNTPEYIFIGCFFVTVYLLLRKDIFFQKTSILFLCIIILNYAPYTLSTKFIEYPMIFPCHKFISQFFWLAFLLFITDRIILRYTHLSRFIAPLFIILTTIFIFYDNNIHPWKYKKPLFHAMPKFLKTVKEVEERHLEDQHQQIIIKTRGTDGTRVTAKVGDQSRNAEIIDEIFIR